MGQVQINQLLTQNMDRFSGARSLADEIEAAPADAVFPTALQDYAVLRAQIRQGCK